MGKMLVLRLQRTGRRNNPTFRLVVTEKSAPIKGKVKEYLGHYLPTRNPHVFEFQEERITHWISMGARPSDTVARLLHKAGMKGTEKFIKKYTKQKKKKKEEEAPAAASVPAAGDTPTKKEEPTESAAEKEAPAEPPKSEKESKPEEAKKDEEAKPEEDKKEENEEVKAEAKEEPPAKEEEDDKEDKKE